MIIGISGIAGAGKDSAADILVADHDYVKVSLADPLKRMCKDVYAFTDDQLWGPSQARNTPDARYPREDGTYLTPREALQRLGTEWGRECYRNTWVELCVRTAQTILNDQNADYTSRGGVFFDPGRHIRGVAIPDVRFRNELSAIRAAGGRVIRIKRPGAGLGGAAGLHASEMEQASILDEEFDSVIDNSGTLEDLRIAIHRFLI